jgi:hypothetical protein
MDRKRKKKKKTETEGGGRIDWVGEIIPNHLNITQPYLCVINQSNTSEVEN